MKLPKTSKNDGLLQDFSWCAKRVANSWFVGFQEKKHWPPPILAECTAPGGAAGPREGGGGARARQLRNAALGRSQHGALLESSAAMAECLW